MTKHFGPRDTNKLTKKMVNDACTRIKARFIHTRVLLDNGHRGFLVMHDGKVHAFPTLNAVYRWTFNPSGKKAMVGDGVATAEQPESLVEKLVADEQIAQLDNAFLTMKAEDLPDLGTSPVVEATETLELLESYRENTAIFFGVPNADLFKNEEGKDENSGASLP